MNLFPKVIIVINVLFAVPLLCRAQTSFEVALSQRLDSLLGASDKRTLYPNAAPKSALTPTGWGGVGTYVVGGIGFSHPQMYHNNPDMVAAVGVTTGNVMKAVSVTAFVNVNNLSEFDNFSYNFIVARSITRGGSISAGALHLFADPVKTDAGPSYFVAFSQAIQSLPSSTPGVSKLTYTIGIGSGRFREKSPLDIKKGRGKYGTGVFGNVSYQVLKNTNINAEWSGLNLGFSMGTRPYRKLPGIMIGVADVTRYSGRHVRLVVGIGYALSLTSFTQ